ncbi:hypothetical protein COLO4_24039 [Corchorus olitorius]|uniref:Uncharacterized protein n=1 Tax=Corchorus olitorius TaxID=93759 RepID=A0A1R3ID95_9ROSI|nr:hypothetical protein COLO4_24039 [Corchorus olitorius]
MGKLVAVDPSLDMEGWSRFLKVRAEIDITKPLRRAILVGNNVNRGKFIKEAGTSGGNMEGNRTNPNSSDDEIVQEMGQANKDLIIYDAEKLTLAAIKGMSLEGK